MYNEELFSSLLVIPQDPLRDISDAKFYAFQDNLNINKEIAGIHLPKYCSNNHLNIHERLAELEHIHHILGSELTTIEVSLKLAESMPDLAIDTGVLIKKAVQINQNITKILNTFNKISADRSFLPLLYPSYEEYSKYVNHFDYNIYFLDKVFTTKNPLLPSYSKVAFDNTELLKVISIMLGSYNPKDVITRLAIFFNINPDRLALTYFNPRFSGFTVYIHPDNIELNNKLVNLNKSHPYNFNHIESDSAWILNFQNSDVIESDFLTNIDIWFDLEQCVSYVADQCLPIDFEVNVPIEYDLNKDYLKSLYFDYTNEATLINRHDLINKLRVLIPKENPKHLEVFNGEEFELLNSYRIWTFSEYILIRYKVGSDITKQAIFRTKDLQCFINGFATDDISEKMVKVFTNNLYLLKISGFEKYNPYMLVADPSTPFEEMS